VSVLVVGISHRSAPVALLEKVTAGLHDTGEVVAQLTEAGPAGKAVNEGVVVSTCNRVEVYVDVDAFHAGLEAVTDLLVRESGVPLSELRDHLYVHWERAAVLHLFEVACGLDSMVVGESQILGQLRRAYAASTSGAGRTLHELFQRALHVGKRAHSETALDEAGQTLVSVGLEHAVTALGSLLRRDVLVIGAGSMGALAGATLRRAGVGQVTVANRTADNARRLAQSLDGQGIGLEDLEAALTAADVVVSSTGATGVVVAADTVAAAVAARGGRPLVILDLALPRDIDPSVRDLPGVTLVDLETLQELLQSTASGADVDAARAIVVEEEVAFLAWQRGARVGPTVAALRSRADEVVDAELARLDNRLPDLDDRVRAELAQALRRTVQTLLHTPTVRVKELADHPEPVSYDEALRELFGLDRSAPAAVATSPVLAETELSGTVTGQDLTDALEATRAEGRR
jgi:glutamyl-tRNA reductase